MHISNKSIFRLSVLFGLLLSQAAYADLLGAAAGGIIGSQMGRGNGRVAMAAVGAVIGDRLTTPPPSPYGYNQRYYSGYPVQPGYVASAPIYATPAPVYAAPNYYASSPVVIAPAPTTIYVQPGEMGPHGHRGSYGYYYRGY